MFKIWVSFWDMETKRSVPTTTFIHDMQMVCDFDFFLELITGVTSANEIIQYATFCRILSYFSLSLSLSLPLSLSVSLSLSFSLFLSG